MACILAVQAIKIFTFGVILTFSKPQNTRKILEKVHYCSVPKILNYLHTTFTLYLIIAIPS
jgi:hypothetical protein